MLDYFIVVDDGGKRRVCHLLLIQKGENVVASEVRRGERGGGLVSFHS